jgi:predicted Zn finger-like uncharacterized protein
MAALKITCPSCGAGIEIPETDSDRLVVRCPKCGKGFPLAREREEDTASADGRRAPAKKRPRPGIAWGFACARMVTPVFAH